MALPIIKIKGNYYEAGFQTGSAMKSQIHGALRDQPLLPDVLMPFYETPEGGAFVQGLLQRASDHFPQYARELQGLADGAQVAFIHLLLLNLSVEITTLLKGDSGTSVDGCTDLLYRDRNNGYIVHTEDGIPAVADRGFIVEATITSDNGNAVLERFVSFSWPGIILGSTFGFNDAGLCWTMNIIFQTSLNERGIPSRFMVRSILGATSVEQATKLLSTPPGITTGINYNFLRTSPDGTPSLSYMEVIGTGSGTVVHENYVTGFQYHTNRHKHLASAREISSETRERRISDMMQEHSDKVTTLDDLLKMTGDTACPDYPIFKNASPPDFWATAAISVFDIRKKRLSVYTNKPTSSNPEHCFNTEYHSWDA